MEDEECLPENSNLKTYLEDLGFYDMQIKKSATSTSSLKFEVPLEKSKQANAEWIEEEVLKEIEILISTHLMFEEDVANVENILSSFKIKKYGMLRNMFQGMFGIIMFFGLLLYWMIGGYAFFISSSVYAYKAADYLWKSKYNQSRLKKLSSILQSNYSLLSKTIKFINENNRFLDSNNLVFNSRENRFSNELDFYNSFKVDFNEALNDVIEILSKATHKLIINLPLLEYVENPQYYICNSVNENYIKSLDLSKLYQIYLLVQAEFLQRLILSLIPNISLYKNSNFYELNKVLTECCIQLLKIKNKLNKKFKYIFFNGIINFKSDCNLNLTEKPKMLGINYEEEFASNIHDVSNTFQNLLIKSRILEENFKLKKSPPQDLENDLVSMQTELNFCQKNISDGFILLKKASGVSNKNEMLNAEEKIIKNFDEREKVLISCTDLNPVVEDEVFEAYFSDENEKLDSTNVEECNVEDTLKKKLEREYSKNVITELKTKLVQKAKDWEEREAKLIPKKIGNFKKFENLEEHEWNKNIKEPSKDIAYNKLKNDLSKNKSEDLFNTCESQYEKCKTELMGKLFTDSSNEKNIVSNMLMANEHHTNGLQFVNKDFLNDLNFARQKILKANNTDEQYYCNSDTSSNESD